MLHRTPQSELGVSVFFFDERVEAVCIGEDTKHALRLRECSHSVAERLRKHIVDYGHGIRGAVTEPVVDLRIICGCERDKIDRDRIPFRPVERGRPIDVRLRVRQRAVRSCFKPGRYRDKHIHGVRFVAVVVLAGPPVARPVRFAESPDPGDAVLGREHKTPEPGGSRDSPVVRIECQRFPFSVGPFELHLEPLQELGEPEAPPGPQDRIDCHRS